MSKPKKKAAKAKAKAPKTKGAAVDKAFVVRSGSKLETIVGLLKRPEGCTAAECMKLTGWPSISMPQQARAAGLTLAKEKVDGVTHYRAA